MSINKVTLIGRLGADPEIQYLPNGTCKAQFSLATNESYKDKEGKLQNVTDWHSVIAWGRIAETVEKLLKSGYQVYIEGKLKYSEFESKSVPGLMVKKAQVKIDILKCLSRPQDYTNSALRKCNSSK